MSFIIIIFFGLLLEPELPDGEWFLVEPSLTSFKPVFSSSRSTVAISKGQTKEDDPDVETSLRQDDGQHAPHLYSCLYDGCIKVFQCYSSLENHLLGGKCSFRPERQGLLDTAIEKYVSKLQQGTSEVPTIPEETATPSATTPLPSLSRGWALKQHKKAVRFSAKQREYLLWRVFTVKNQHHKSNVIIPK